MIKYYTIYKKEIIIYQYVKKKKKYKDVSPMNDFTIMLIRSKMSYNVPYNTCPFIIYNEKNLNMRFRQPIFIHVAYHSWLVTLNE